MSELNRYQKRKLAGTKKSAMTNRRGEYLSITEIGEAYGVSRNTALRWTTRHSDFPIALMVKTNNGRLRLFKRSDIQAWLDHKGSTLRPKSGKLVY